MNNKILSLYVLASIALSGCLNMGQKQAGGGVIGAGVGGTIGYMLGGDSKSLAIGALMGGWAGSSVGQAMDEEDKRLAAEAALQAFETGRSDVVVCWKNPDNDHSGSITPKKAKWHRNKKTYCREFQQTVTIGGKKQKAYGMACRKPDGQWEIVK